MRVSQLSSDAGVSADTVRYYTREGLLTPSRDPGNGYREYGEVDRQRLRFIVSARRLGFSVADIAVILGEADRGETPCPTVRHLLEERLQEVDRRLREMAALRQRMQAALADWQDKPDRAPTGRMVCHLIENFAD